MTFVFGQKIYINVFLNKKVFQNKNKKQLMQVSNLTERLSCYQQ